MANDPEGTLARLSISLPSDLFQQLDVMVAERELPSRSQLIAELIRDALVAHEEIMDPEAGIAGTISVTYRGESGRVRQRIAQIQAEYLDEVISSQHVNLTKDHSLEVLITQGPAFRLRLLCDEIRKLKGVEQLNFAATSTILPAIHNGKLFYESVPSAKAA